MGRVVVMSSRVVVRWVVMVGAVVLVAVAVGGVASAGSGQQVSGSIAGTVIGRREVERTAAVRVVALGCGGHSVGSGVLVPGGRVVTNRHVVAGADYVEIQRVDGTRIGAAVERVGADLDLAVLWVGPAAGAGIEPGGRLDPGTAVRVLGHPGGGRLVVGDGRVTARARFTLAGMRSDEAAYVDARVAAGNSGGPVFDGAGRLAGVVFAVENHTGLAAVIDGAAVAGFLAGDHPSGDPAACEPEQG